MNETLTSGHRTITALFDTKAEADSAVQKLVAAGVQRSEIDVRGTGASTGAASMTRDDDKGFWESLKDLFVPEDDRAAYTEGLRRGGYIVVVRADTAHYEKALDILEDEGTVNLDERVESWRKEGWTGYSAAPALGAAGAAGAAPTGRVAAKTDTMQADSEEVISVVEEELRIGKREVDHGRVRVRSYMVETPVQEQVTLREEQVTIQRRPVDRAVTGNEALFQDRTIEATERTEEAVVSKEARVKEELVIGKTATQRTETVSDSVKRTEVEVEDERGVKVSQTGTTTTTPRRAG